MRRDSGNKKPHRLFVSGVSEISCVNQNPTAALPSSSAFASSRMFKFRITAQNVWIVCTRVNGIFPILLNRNPVCSQSLRPEAKRLRLRERLRLEAEERFFRLTHPCSIATLRPQFSKSSYVRHASPTSNLGPGADHRRDDHPPALLGQSFHAHARRRGGRGARAGNQWKTRHANDA